MLRSSPRKRGTTGQAMKELDARFRGHERKIMMGFANERR
jgi:hypothetical protein